MGKRNRTINKVLAFALAFVLVFCVNGFAVAAEQKSDDPVKTDPAQSVEKDVGGVQDSSVAKKTGDGEGVKDQGSQDSENVQPEDADTKDMQNENAQAGDAQSEKAQSEKELQENDQNEDVIPSGEKSSVKKNDSALKDALNDSSSVGTIGDFVVKGDEEDYSFKSYSENENGQPEDGTLTIAGDVMVTTKSATTQNIIIDADCTVILAGVNINSFAGPAILVKAPHKVELILKENSENVLFGAPGKDINATKGSYSAIEPEFLYEDSEEPANVMSSLTISGSGKLTAQGAENGAGIGGSNSAGGSKGRGLYGNITINSGDITAIGTGGGAGIGSSNTPKGGTSVGSYKATGNNKWGTITINGGTIHARGANSAAIGGGNHMDSGKVVINGGTIVAEGGSGIGTGTGSSKAQGYSWMDEKGPGHYFADIEINGGDITARAVGDDNWGGAGIGGGAYCDAKVVITGGTIKAYGGSPGSGHNALHHGGAGIGGGYEGHADITISGGDIYAEVGETSTAAAIGSGGTPNSNPDRGNTGRSTKEGITFLTETVVSISGGTIVADARAGGTSRGGAGIGGGTGADKVTVNISGGDIKAYGSKSDEDNKLGGAGIGGGLYGASETAPGMSKSEAPKYQVNTDVNVSITGGTVLAVGGWGASGIGSGAKAKFAETINADFSKADIEAYADGTKFAIDTRNLHEDGTTTSYTEGRTITGNMIQGTFVHAGEIGDYEQNPEGLSSIKVTNDRTDETKELTQMPEKYRSYATGVSEAGAYTVYTDDQDIGHGEGRFFSVCSKDVYAEENVSKNFIQYGSETNKLSDNFYLFPVKTIVIKKTVNASDGIKKAVNGNVYFSLQQKDDKEFLKKGDGSQWIESIEIKKGEPQSKAYFVNIPDKQYDVWEVDEEGKGIKTGDSGYQFGNVTLLRIETRHGDDNTNNAELNDEIWTDKVEVINTYDKALELKLKKKISENFKANDADDSSDNNTFVFRVTAPNKEDPDSPYYDNYLSFSFDKAGEQDTAIALIGTAEADKLVVEEVYAAGYKPKDGRKQIIDLDKVDRTEPVEIGFENEFDGDVSQKSGIINTYKDGQYKSDKSGDTEEQNGEQ